MNQIDINAKNKWIEQFTETCVLSAVVVVAILLCTHVWMVGGHSKLDNCEKFREISCLNNGFCLFFQFICFGD